MYESFFGLKGHPFKLSPDPGFFYASATHAKGLAYLHYGLQRGEGFVVITGLPGTGKTTLLNILMKDLSPGQFVMVKLSNTLLNVDDLFRSIALLLNLKSSGRDKVELLEELELYLQQLVRIGKRVLFMIDEAHHLSSRILEELRLLSNFQYREKYTLQIFLLGQFQLEETLNLPEMLQLRQRVLASHRLEPISAKEISHYMEHRLGTVGWQGKPTISEEAFQMIHHYTEGIPRQINTLSDRVMLYAYLEEKNDIDGYVVDNVVDELRLEPASYVHGQQFSEVQIDDELNKEDKLYDIRKKYRNAPDLTTKLADNKIAEFGKNNVIAWPKDSLDYQETDSRFPVDYAYPNALQDIDDNIVSNIKANNGLTKNLLLEIAQNHIANNQKKIEETNTEDTLNAKITTEILHEVKSGDTPSLVEEEIGIKGQPDHLNPNFVNQNKKKRKFNKWITLFSTTSAIAMFFAVDWYPVDVQTNNDITGIVVPEPVSLRPSETNVTIPETKEIMTDEKPKTIITDIISIEEPDSVIVATAVKKPKILTQKPLNKKLTLETDKSNIKQKSIMTIATKSFPPSEIARPKKIEKKTLEKKVLVKKVVQIPEKKIVAAIIKAERKKPLADNKVIKPQIVKNKIVKPAKKVIKIASTTLTSIPPKKNEHQNEFVLETLIKRFIIAYQEGEISTFIALFSKNITSNDSLGVNEFENEYKKLFNVTDVRQIEIDDFSWEENQDSIKDTISGEGDFQLTILEKGSNKPILYNGGISLEVDMNQPEPVITQIYYSYIE